jgi:protein arginine N-methyltransferase 5
MLTSPITTPSFRQRVQDVVKSSLDAHTASYGQAISPTVSPLALFDTAISPGGISCSLLALTSPWIDLCSPDPLIADVSRQVLVLEITFAAFCGVEYVFIPGPRLYHGDVKTRGTPQYARVIQEALSIATHMQVHIMFQMIDDPSVDSIHPADNLGSLTREEYLDDAEELRSQKPDIYGTWEAWHVIRTVCKYSSRLSVGKD